MTMMLRSGFGLPLNPVLPEDLPEPHTGGQPPTYPPRPPNPTRPTIPPPRAYDERVPQPPRPGTPPDPTTGVPGVNPPYPDVQPQYPGAPAPGVVPGYMTPEQTVPWYKHAWAIPVGLGVLTLAAGITIGVAVSRRRRVGVNGF